MILLKTYESSVFYDHINDPILPKNCKMNSNIMEENLLNRDSSFLKVELFVKRIMSIDYSHTKSLCSGKEIRSRTVSNFQPGTISILLWHRWLSVFDGNHQMPWQLFQSHPYFC